VRSTLVLDKNKISRSSLSNNTFSRGFLPGTLINNTKPLRATSIKRMPSLTSSTLLQYTLAPSCLQNNQSATVIMATPRAVLPNELWFAIIDLLGRADLPSFSRTSKLFHRLVEPTLYSKLNTHHHKDGVDKSLTHFLRTIIRNPKLALHVKHANLRVVGKTFNSRTYESYAVGTLDVSFATDKDRSLLKEHISQSLVHEDDRNTWHKTIFSERNFDAAAAYILFITSLTIESLTMMNYGVSISNSYIHCILSHCPLSKLRSVSLNQNEVRTEANYLTIANFLPYLAKDITNLSGHGISDVSFKSNGQKYAINSLDLFDCRLTDSALKNFLGTFILKKLA
jgi:hypothetical protein